MRRLGPALWARVTAGLAGKQGAGSSLAGTGPLHGVRSVSRLSAAPGFCGVGRAGTKASQVPQCLMQHVTFASSPCARKSAGRLVRGREQSSHAMRNFCIASLCSHKMAFAANAGDANVTRCMGLPSIGWVCGTRPTRLFVHKAAMQKGRRIAWDPFCPRPRQDLSCGGGR